MKKFLLILCLLPVTALADPSPVPASDKLQSALADMVNKSVEVAGDAKDFLSEQLPDTIKQLLMWKMAQSIAYCALSILLFAVVGVAFRKYWAFCSHRDWDMDEHGDAIFPASLGMALFGVILLVCAFSCFNLTWLQIWLAPKVYLIEYAKSAIFH